MKRFAAIVTVVVVVLAMSAGTAFANVCVGGSCDGSMALCSAGASAVCPMGGGFAIARPGCDHGLDKGAREAVFAQTGTDRVVGVLAPLAAVPDPVTVSAALASPAADARGAPHLTIVIRI